jgi:ribosomal protein S12 methylthiotransferase
LPVLVEGPHPETDLLAVGRLPTQAPEVDGQVIITEGEATVGQIVSAEIVRSHDYDLEARLVL